MAGQNPGFRDFGILPEDLPPPPDKVRCFFSTGRVVGQYIGTAIVSLLGLGFAMMFALAMTMPLNLLACAAALAGFGAFVFLATHHDYRWVELEGSAIRAKHLYTGRVIERSVEDIECLGTMVYQVKTLSTVAMEKLLGRIKGIEIRFRDGRTPLRILRADPAMTNALEFIQAVLYRMSRVGDLDTKMVLLDGQPLVRNIHWKGEEPRAAPPKSLKVLLCCLILMALMAGTITGFWGLAESKRLEIGSVPAHEITVQSLIDHGPGANRHVILTGFRPGGYAVESRSASWRQVWIALFPAGTPPEADREIKVVFQTNAVREPATLAWLMRSGRLTAICSDSPRSSWGTVLGPEIVKANNGLPLASAWSIEEMRELPDKETVKQLLWGATGSFAAMLLFSLIVFWKA
jgi:hypothetical protein